MDNSSWIPVYISLITAVVTVLGSYLVAKTKQKTNDFQSLIDANTKLREELKDDLLKAREEIKTLHEERRDCLQKVESLEIQVNELRLELQRHKQDS